MKYLVVDRNNDKYEYAFNTSHEVAAWMINRQLDHYEFYKRLTMKKTSKGLKIEYKRVLITSNNFEFMCRELSYS